MAGYRRDFDETLQAIEAEVIELFAMIAEDLPRATAALLTDDDELEQKLAIPMGAGIGLTFDEAALLLDLRDVYWTREGLLSVQLSLGATAILSIAILTLRMLRRGERRQEQEGLIPPAHPHQLSFGTAG